MVNERLDWHSTGSPWNAAAIVEHRLEEYLAFCVQGREFEAGIDEMDCRVAKQELDLRAIGRPRELAYAWCLHHARGLFEATDLHDAGRRILQARLADGWLNAGHTMRAAMWLKIVYWDSEAPTQAAPRLSPLQKVLRAYHNMPDVVVPAFVHAEVA